jgi:hypothetical protein
MYSPTMHFRQHYGLGAPADAIASAQAALDVAKGMFGDGDNQTDDGFAITSFKQASNAANAAAAAAASTASDIAAAKANALGLSAAASNMASAAADANTSAQSATTRNDARTYANQTIVSADQGIVYANQANALLASGANAPPGVAHISAATAAAGNALIAYLTSSGCDCTQDLVDVTAAFQRAYNTDTTGTKAFPVVDGKYGAGTAAILASVAGSSPSPCYGHGNPCFGVPTKPGKNNPVKPPPPPPAPPPPHTTPGLTNVSTLTTTAKTNWTPWIIGGVALAAGAGLLVYAHKQKSEGHKPSALPPSHASDSIGVRRRSRRL